MVIIYVNSFLFITFLPFVTQLQRQLTHQFTNIQKHLKLTVYN